MEFCFKAILAANDEAETLNMSLVIQKFLTTSRSFFLKTKRCKSCWVLGRRLVQYIWLMSVAIATLWQWNLTKMSNNGEWIIGPTSNWSFNDTFIEDLAKAPNTTCNFVVWLVSLHTVCIGSFTTWLRQILGLGLTWHDFPGSTCQWCDALRSGLSLIQLTWLASLLHTYIITVYMINTTVPSTLSMKVRHLIRVH